MSIVLNGSTNNITVDNVDVATDTDLALKAPLDGAVLTNATINGVAQSGYTGFKNYIINGGFDIWQRGTSGTTNGYTYLADRFKTGYYAGTQSQSLNEVLPNGEIVTALKMNNTSNSSGVLTQQVVEFGKQFSNKTVTLSFWIKLETSVDKQAYILFDGGNQGLYHTGNIGTSWTKVSFTRTFGDLSSWADDKGMSVYIGSDQVLQNEFICISQVQLEEGSVATPFEQRPYGLELSLCQRYYEKITYLISGVASYGSIGILVYTDAPFNTTKRVAPTINCTALSANGYDTTRGVGAVTTRSASFYAVTNYTGAASFFYETSLIADAEL